MTGTSVNFSTEQLAYIDQLARRSSKSRGAVVRRLVEWAMRHARNGLTAPPCVCDDPVEQAGKRR